MQNVSSDWLEANKETIIDGCFVEVTLELSAPTTLYMASTESTGELEILSDVTEIVNEPLLKKYGTLEKNLWLLDGSIFWADENNNFPAGYISDSICDENCSFSSLPIVKVTPETAQDNIYGVTITFSELFNEYATEFELIFWLNNDFASSKLVTNNKLVVCPVQLEAEEFDKLEIRIYKWCFPEHRARIENIFMGYRKQFKNSELVEFGIDKSVSIVNATLPEDTLEFSIDRTKVDFELNSDDTLSKYFRQEQKVIARLGMRTSNGAEKYISGGVYYLYEWDFKRGSIKGNFTAKSIISFMNQPYTKGKYYQNGISLWQLATDVLLDASKKINLEFKWKLSNHLRTLYTTAPLPVCTWAECLQYIAHAAGAMLTVTRENEIRIMTTTYTGTETDYVITNSVLFDYPKVELMKQLKSVSCDIFSNKLGEEDTLYKSVHLIDGSTEIVAQYKSSGDITYTLTPYQSEENIQVDEYEIYAENSTFKISGSGYVLLEIKGKPLSTSSSLYTISVSDSGGEEHIQNPIITNAVTAKKACEAAASWLKNRSQETFSEFRADPRLDAGDFVKYRNENVLISNVKYNFTGMFRGNCLGRIGYSPFVAPETDEIPDINTHRFPDVNGDGVADAADSAIIQKAATKIAIGEPSGLTPEQEILADADRDGDISAVDASLVLQFAAETGVSNYEQSVEGWEQFLRKRGVI